MPDGAISVLTGIALTCVLMRALVLIGRFEDKKIREQQEGGT